jgi:hypothetical protein
MAPSPARQISSNRRRPRLLSAIAIAFLLVLTESVYLRPSLVDGTEQLVGSDYKQLHVRHIAFAREALLGVRHTVPGWDPHEFMGTPFAANLQSFPWIPTRFALFLLDPEIAYVAGVAIAAGLAALFTFLYCRRAGLSRLGSVAAGWTFACAGYFTSRVAAGHLPLLEAYPALPLLLWLTDRALAPERFKRHAFDLGALALASACVVVAGHPQIPAYSFAATLLYVACLNVSWRQRDWLGARVMAAIGLGIGSTCVILWPMLLLIGRSTRILHLAPADNDVAMPYRRLLSLIVPGIDGYALPIQAGSGNLFRGYPNTAYFWDTVCYVGIVPLLSLAGLVVLCVWRKQLPRGRWMFLAVLGTGAFLFALPVGQVVFHLLPGTLLRSSCRLFYLWTFCVAAALGASVDAVRGMRLRGGTASMVALLAVAMGLHFVDLGRFDEMFILTSPRRSGPPAFEETLRTQVGDRRIGSDPVTGGPYADRYDDVGGFDSIWLARFDQGIVALTGDPADENEEELDGSDLTVAALEATGVRFVITPDMRADLELVARTSDTNLYRVPNPVARAGFFAAERARFSAEEKIPNLFAGNPYSLILPDSARRYLHGEGGAGGPAKVQYLRPNSDEIRLQAEAGQPGFVHVVEAWDLGWTATLDGSAAPVLRANGFLMAVPVSPGRHSIVLRYRTPGRTVGAVLSLVSLGLLTGLLCVAKTRLAQTRRIPRYE